MNLLPAPTRERISSKRSVARWIALYASAGAVLVLITVGLRVHQASLRSSAARLEQEASIDAEATAKLTAIRTDVETLSRSITFNARLALPVLTSDILAVIAEALPQSITLTSVAMTPSFASAPPNPGETPLPPSPVSLALELSGVARSDLDIASLVASLDAHPLFDRATLDHARPKDLDGLTVREFSLSLEVDLASRSPLSVSASPTPTP
ncbi:MAG: PilN domain-containing protein [Phycisphaerales bacterium]